MEAQSSIGEIARVRIGDRRAVVSISGGKDSAATSLHLRELGIEHDLVFADTGWEHPKTYEYLRGPLTSALGPIREVKADLLFADLVRKKRLFPDRTKRFCTTMLKVEPIGAYLESLGVDFVNVLGIRRDESQARRAALEWDYSPKLDCYVWRPILLWTVADVIAIHRRHNLTPNPLYGMGARRVGCWPCIHARKSDIRLVADTDPERIDAIRSLENEVTESARVRANAAGVELDWPRSLFSLREGTKTADEDTGELRRHHRPMDIDEAVAWARTERPPHPQLELFADPNSSCGEWGFCETEDT
jgi:3'-phosphoadenosine 5'-phosphosulfate sulfotransferase (PAPS reductase)/FAD synthetase